MQERAGGSAKFYQSGGVMSASSFHGGSTALQAAVPGSAAAELSSLRYFVELKAGETTYVSWKKLLQDAHKAESKSGVPAGANPALEARISPETGGSVVVRDEEQPQSGADRFRDVIQKIETLYRGVDSEGEESDPVDEQYDTDDSFIDDQELDDYFAVESSKLKHTGFYIHRGPLEPASEPSSPPAAGPKKRKRKDAKLISKDVAEGNSTDDDATEDDFPEDDTPKSLKIDPGVRMKVAARKVPASGGPKAGQDTYAGHKSSDTGKQNYQRKDAHSRNDQGRGIVVDITGDRAQSDMRNREDKRDKHHSTSHKAAAEGFAGETSSRKSFGAYGEDLKDRNGSSADEKQKEVSPGRRMKGTMLERAMQDLEKGVAAMCPPTAEGQESEKPGHSGGKNKRLPRDVKNKLAKVARLSSKQGRIPKEVVQRLSLILGDKMRLPTLKYNLKKMVEMGITANQEKEGRLQNIKGEVTEMIKCRMKAQACDGSSDDFQASCGGQASASGRYEWDQATEDRICDLYDLYVEGLDEHKGPKLRKLYGELANLWPEGWMDNVGIKQAVGRAKMRKKRLLKGTKNREEPKKTPKVPSGSEKQQKEERAIPKSEQPSKPKIPRPDSGQIQSTVKKEVAPSSVNEEILSLKGERKLKRPASDQIHESKQLEKAKSSVNGKRLPQQPLKMTKKRMSGLVTSAVKKSSSSRATSDSQKPLKKQKPAEQQVATKSSQPPVKSSPPQPSDASEGSSPCT